jgi:hypothetical protein
MARAPRAPRSFNLSLGGIDNALVVRVNTRPLRPVYVIPFSILHLYALKGLTPADQRNLDQFFATQTRPKVDAAVTETLNIADGSA